jgi:hypothetical protein
VIYVTGADARLVFEVTWNGTRPIGRQQVRGRFLVPNACVRLPRCYVIAFRQNVNVRGDIVRSCCRHKSGNLTVGTDADVVAARSGRRPYYGGDATDSPAYWTEAGGKYNNVCE